MSTTDACRKPRGALCSLNRTSWLFLRQFRVSWGGFARCSTDTRLLVRRCMHSRRSPASRSSCPCSVTGSAARVRRRSRCSASVASSRRSSSSAGSSWGSSRRAVGGAPITSSRAGSERGRRTSRRISCRRSSSRARRCVRVHRRRCSSTRSSPPPPRGFPAWSRRRCYLPERFAAPRAGCSSRSRRTWCCSPPHPV